MRAADAVVIGGGINGAVTAYHLVRLGIGTVMVVDAGSSIPSATSRSAAIFTTYYPSEHDAELARDGLRAYQEFAETARTQLDFKQTGVLHLVSPQAHGAAVRTMEVQRRLGIDVELLSPGELQTLVPRGDFDDTAAGVFERRGGFADPVQTNAVYLDEALRGGAVIERNARVLQILSSRNRVTGVRTDSGTIHSPIAVIAAGVGALAFVEDIGVQARLSVRRVKVASFLDIAATHDGQPVIVDHVAGAWIRPAAQNLLLVGLEFGAPVVDDQSSTDGVDSGYAAVCRSKLMHRLKFGRPPELQGGWSGTITMSADGRPVVDRSVDTDGLYFTVGDSGTSFKLAPALGKYVAQWIAEGAGPPAAIAHLGRARFDDWSATSEDRDTKFAQSARLARELRAHRST